VKKRKSLAAIFLFLVFPAGAICQFTPYELSARPKIEMLLKTAKITKSVAIREGVTKPYRLFLASEEGEISGCWKNVTGSPKGYLDEWRFEIAAYEMDKLLGVNMVPPTVEKEFDNKKGSIQLWVNTEYSLKDVADQHIRFPSEKQNHLTRMRHLSRAFDCLIANEDRTAQNLRFTDDWRVILIDHSRSFRASKVYTDRLIFGRNGIQGKLPILTLPHAFVEKIRSLSLENIKAAVGPYLKKKEINAILKRKDLLLTEIQDIVQERGEDKFYYR
jgi:hypothetical protein